MIENETLILATKKRHQLVFSYPINDVFNSIKNINQPVFLALRLALDSAILSFSNFISSDTF
jgi:hypothetical protein